MPANQRNSVDDKGRGAARTQLRGGLVICLYLVGVLASVQASVELGLIQRQVESHLFQVVYAESTLVFTIIMLIQAIVKSPVLIVPLIAGAGGRLRCIPAFLTEKRKVYVTKLNYPFIDKISS